MIVPRLQTCMLNPVPCPSDLLHHLVTAAAERDGERIALSAGTQHLSYASVHAACQAAAAGFIALGLARAERVAIYLDKRAEFVVAAFGTSAAGGVFVPVNPNIHPEPDQVGHILRDCNVRVLVTSAERLATLRDTLAGCHDLRHVVLTGRAGQRAGAEWGIAARLGRASGRARAPSPSRHRRRHGGHPVHLGQHRPPQGRGAVRIATW